MTDEHVVGPRQLGGQQGLVHPEALEPGLQQPRPAQVGVDDDRVLGGLQHKSGHAQPAELQIGVGVGGAALQRGGRHPAEAPHGAGPVMRRLSSRSKASWTLA